MNINDIKIRETNAGDFDEVMQVEKEAFGYEKEARLVADLLADRSAEPLVSLLAFHQGRAVGHVLFTRAFFEGRSEQPMVHILAPLAVIPEYQRQGDRWSADPGGNPAVTGIGVESAVCAGTPGLLSPIRFYVSCSPFGLSRSLSDTGRI